jgi:RNA polymerase-binding transcription factor
LIWVKRPHGSGAKLEFNRCRKAPTVPKKPFSEFSALLQAQRKQLLGEVREKITSSGEGLGFANQSKITDDDALADAAAELDVAMVIRESQVLQDIEAALARIADGSYGNCTDCGGEIGRARLKAYPTAERCLPCQEKYEHVRGQVRTPRL